MTQLLVCCTNSSSDHILQERPAALAKLMRRPNLGFVREIGAHLGVKGGCQRAIVAEQRENRQEGHGTSH